MLAVMCCPVPAAGLKDLLPHLLGVWPADSQELESSALSKGAAASTEGSVCKYKGQWLPGQGLKPAASPPLPSPPGPSLTLIIKPFPIKLSNKTIFQFQSHFHTCVKPSQFYGKTDFKLNPEVLRRGKQRSCYINCWRAGSTANRRSMNHCWAE